MELLAGVPVSTLKVVASVGIGIVGLISAFLGSLWYWSLDRETEKYDEEVRENIKEEPAFSGIRVAAAPEFFATSDSKASKTVSLARKAVGGRSRKPDKIVAVDGDTLEERKIEMVRERAREIPGKNILSNDLVATIRNYYAYKLALNSDGVGSGVVEHFRSRLEDFEHSEKVDELGTPDNYEEVSLITEHITDGNRDPLNDIFLRLVRAAELYCIDETADVNDQHEQIEECQSYLMLCFFSLWAKSMKGVEVHGDIEQQQCLSEYRRDIRDEDNWGYWVLPKEECEEPEFKRIRHMGWKIRDILNQYWEDQQYSVHHSHGDSIRNMEHVAVPFLVFLKDEEVFRGGGPGGQK